MLVIVLMWFCWSAGVAPLWLAIVGTVFKSIELICRLIIAICKAIEKNIDKGVEKELYKLW